MARDALQSTMKRLAGATLAMLVLDGSPSGPASAQMQAERINRGLVELITGSSDSTALRMAEDLANVFDDSGTRRILPVVGKGSLQNIADLRLLRGIDIALVQSDVLEYARARHLYPGMEGSITYIAKLYNAEFHLLAREDIRTINDLIGKKVNFGPASEGTAITGPIVFNQLKIGVDVTSYATPLALEKLRSGEIAALATVSGKPAPVFRGLRADDGFHFVSIPLSSAVVGSYLPALLTHDDYPELVTEQEPLRTVATGMVMIVAPLVTTSERYRNVVKFVDVFFTQFQDLLEAPHHPKWREVNLAAELPGWRRFASAEVWLKQNASTPVAANRQQLREIFSGFLDARSRIAGGTPLSAQQKEQLFEQFERWQSGQADRAVGSGSSRR